MWINHSSMNTVIAGNMNVTGITMAPGFSQSGTWYDYLSGEPVNVTDPGNQTFTFAPGEFRVFTSKQLAKPFHEVMVVARDSATNALITGAEVTFQGAGTMQTDTQGKAIFITFPGQVLIKALKTGYKQYIRTFEINASGEITLLLQKGASSIPETDDPFLKLFPNPCGDAVSISSESDYTVTLLSLQGAVINMYTINTGVQNIDLSGMAAGIYLLRFESIDRSFTRKLMVTGHEH
jgi:hypothetical protein